MSLTLFLILVAAAIVWVVSRLRWPLRPCTKCGGKGTNAGSNRKRHGRCNRCKGTRQVKRFGATAVHRFLWSVAGDAMQRRAHEKVENAKQKAGYPE